MEANLSGVPLRRSSVVVHPDASKCNELGPRIVCVFELLRILFKISIARQAARDRRPLSTLNPLLHCTDSSAVSSLDISLERNRNEAVTIGHSREHSGIVKRDL